MIRGSLRILAVAAVAAFALVPAPASAVTPVSGCRGLDRAGETYVLTADISASMDPCFFVDADRITLDLNGHTITGTNGVGIWDGGASRTSTVVKNGRFTKFNEGILLEDSTRSTVRAVNASDNHGRGIIVGPNSLVKDCTVLRNALGGITAGDGGQVEGCLVQDNNGGFGILGGQRMLVTRNTVIGNGSGIEVGRNSTVTHNTSTGNGESGIAVDAGSLVSRNTANGNGGSGIYAVCPSTVTHNTALGNTINFNPIGPAACIDLHNTFAP